MNWKCGVCNLIWKGDGPPEACPKCASPGEKYAELSDEQWALIERSRVTNDLYMRLLAMIPGIEEIADRGVDDNLDPWCHALHERILEDVRFWKRSIVAEINGHVNRGKWG